MNGRGAVGVASVIVSRRGWLNNGTARQVLAESGNRFASAADQAPFGRYEETTALNQLTVEGQQAASDRLGRLNERAQDRLFEIPRGELLLAVLKIRESCC